MHQSILITGAFGMFGRQLVPLLLERSQARLILLAHRRGVENRTTEFLSEYFAVAPALLLERVEVLPGDITKEHLGWTTDNRRDLADSITHIIHSAANTRFDLSLEEARNTNLEGTRRITELAMECKALERFGFIGTAYVSGRRSGVILEAELEHGDGFVNTYEQSKYEAELFLRSHRAKLPMAIYRLSSVVGDSRTGIVHNFTAPHQAMRMMHLGLASMMPGTPDYPVDLIAADVAADVVYELFMNRFCPNQVFHITSGPEKSYVLSELIDDVYEKFGAYDDEWRRRGYPKPVLAPADTFDLFLRSVEDANNALLESVLRTIRAFAQQLNYPKLFDQQDLLEVFPEYRERAPDIREYHGKVIRFCLDNDWRRHVA